MPRAAVVVRAQGAVERCRGPAGADLDKSAEEDPDEHEHAAGHGQPRLVEAQAGQADDDAPQRD